MTFFSFLFVLYRPLEQPMWCAQGFMSENENRGA